MFVTFQIFQEALIEVLPKCFSGEAIKNRVDTGIEREYKDHKCFGSSYADSMQWSSKSSC